jgi:hypothetical protein
MPTDEVDPWDYQAAIFAETHGDLAKARILVTWLWMREGDFRPFLAWGGELDPEALLGMFIYLIQNDRLRVKPRGRHRPRDPSAFPRWVYAAHL